MSERQVVFYECQDIEKQPAFNCAAAVEGINALDDDDWRIPDLGSESELAVIVDQVGTSAANPTRMRFIRIRPDKPYKLSAARELKPAEAEQDESFSEFTWAVLWPDDYLAAVSSRDAPSHKRLGRYFYETSGEKTHIVNLFHPDVDKKFKELQERGLRSVEVTLYTSKMLEMERGQDRKGFKQIRAASQGSDAATIKIGWKVRRRKAVLSDAIGKEAAELAEFIDLVESLHIKGRDKDGEIQELNMKHERIGGPIEISDGSSDNAIYRGIQGTRKAIEQEIGSLNRATRGS